MNIHMVPIEIFGLKNDLEVALNTLRDLGTVQIDKISEAPEVAVRPIRLDRDIVRNQEERSFILARIEGLLDMLDCEPAHITQIPAGDHLAEARRNVDKLVPKVKQLADLI